MVAYNRQRRLRFESQLVFDWLEVEFSDLTLSMRLNADCSLEEHGAVELAERVRTLVNDGVLEGDIACVRVPSRASYEAQLAAVEAARAEEAAAQEAAEAEEAAEEPAEDAEAVEAAEATEAAEGGAEDEAAEAEEAQDAEPQPEPEPVNFDIDTTVWGIEYAGGTVREFDSSKDEFVA